MSRVDRMSEIRPEDAQSFWLRFWYERSWLEAGHWRGTVWNQRQHPSESPQPVADPEEAFAVVRHALAQATPVAEPMPPSEDAGRARWAGAPMPSVTVLF